MAGQGKEYSIDEVVGQLHALGLVHGDVLLVHASFRAVRPIEQGPLGLIKALSLSIGNEGTLVMPSWTSDDDAPFDPATTPCDPDLGAVAEVFRQQNGVVRSAHPFAFAARGPRAAEIVGDPIALPPHQISSPVGRVYDCGGRILLIGVDHDANTTIHMCELMANVPYRRPKHITVAGDGNAVRVDYLENDHCCELFCRTNGWLDRQGLQTHGKVANAASKLMDACKLVGTVLPELSNNRFAFLHPRDEDCEQCSDAWKSVMNWSAMAGDNNGK